MRYTLRLTIAVLGTLAAAGVFSGRALAVVQTTGDVLLSPDSDVDVYGGLYADNPFTTTLNEGIPTNGNRIDPFQSPTAQTEFEGREVGATNVNFSVIVGRTSFGELIINQSQLRDMDLVIGDSAMVGGSFKRGSGVVRIEGFGALFNNNPLILPYLGVDPDTAVSPSQTPRPDNVGFDLFVGRSGNGVLQLALGGRAEIQDAAIVGDLSGSVGTLLIDGIDSFLQSGGFETTSTNPDDVNYMIVGRLGSGTMSIVNGGQSYNSGPTQTSGNNETFGAVIGSNLAAVNNAAPGNGGSGTVYVDGVASKWTVAGNLQVGGFHDDRTGIGPLAQDDLEGTLAVYGSGVGRGTLKVSAGALVSIVPPPLDENATNAPNRLDFLVGRFGRVELDSGRIELLGALNNNNPQNPTPEIARGRLINDGVVMGDGNISVLQFRNRVLGEVRVGGGQTMVIAATGAYGQPDNIPVNTEPEEYPLSNYGLIQVQGTPEAPAELEFQRNLVTIPTGTDFTRPFLNLPLLPGPPFAPNGRTGGEIIGQNSIMRFDSDIINRHKVSFTGGTNLVSGNFDNQGTVFVGGDNTNVTFVDQFFNNGVFTMEPNISLVMFIDDVTFGGAGSLDTTFGGRPTGQEVSHIASAENIALDGTLNASLFTSPGFPQFTPQNGDQFEIISSAGDLIGDFADVNLPGCIGGTICFFGFADPTLDAYFVRTFDLAFAVGGDFDGSGLVDDLDFQIWRQHFGETGPIGSLPGDADLNGIVDGVDLLVWNLQFGTPGAPFPGAGSGSLGGGGVSVPEPASVALLAAGGMLALAFARRRTA